jgi:hypothetical protein
MVGNFISVKEFSRNIYRMSKKGISRSNSCYAEEEIHGLLRGLG